MLTTINEKQEANLDQFEVLVEGPKIDFISATIAIPGAAILTNVSSYKGSFSPEDMQEAEEEFQQGVISNALSIREAEEYAVDAYNHPKTKANKSKHRYKINIAITAPNGVPVLVQVCPKYNKLVNKGFIRLEFNPSKLGKTGIAWLYDFILDELFLHQVSALQFFAYCHVTRIDLCVELLGQDLNNLYVVPPPKIRGKRKQYLSADGKLETIYYNIHTKRNSDLYFYNRRQNQLDKGEDPEFGEIAHTRVEKRYDMKNSKSGMFGLKNLKNPFADIKLYNLGDVAPYGFDEAEWEILKEAIKGLGHKKVESLLTEQQRYALLDHLGNEGSAFWYPETVWSGWEDCLDASGLLCYGDNSFHE